MVTNKILLKINGYTKCLVKMYKCSIGFMNLPVLAHKILYQSVINVKFWCSYPISLISVLDIGKQSDYTYDKCQSLYIKGLSQSFFYLVASWWSSLIFWKDILVLREINAYLPHKAHSPRPPGNFHVNKAIFPFPRLSSALEPDVRARAYIFATKRLLRLV